MKKNIDVIVSVIDNFGDIGFCTEMLMELESLSPGDYHYRVWTDQHERVADFFGYNRARLPSYSLSSLSEFGTHEISEFCLVFFHAKIPDHQYFHDHARILRIDYLSLDPDWTVFHESEHISSTPQKQVLEIIPSPVRMGGGILPTPNITDSRYQIAEKYELDPNKKWISLFLYPETLETKIDFTDIPSDREILILGNPYLLHGLMHPHIHRLPFLSIAEFHHILTYSYWCMIRGEVSWMNVRGLNKPFYWNLYSTLGGFPRDQSEQFLDLYGFSDLYRDLHNQLNQSPGRSVTLSAYEEGIFSSENINIFNQSSDKNIVQEVKKYIDSFHFSL